MMFKQTPELQKADEEKMGSSTSSLVINSDHILQEAVNSNLGNDFRNQLDLNSEVSIATPLIFSSGSSSSASSSMTNQSLVYPPLVADPMFQAVSSFLRLVAEGEQDQVEELLKKTPDLALVSGDVTDLSGRSFTGITGFQYSIWALDWHMWTMIQKYLPEDEVRVREQVQGLKLGSWVRQHGESVSWMALISTLDRYIELCNASKYSEARTQWNKQVGGAQSLLPAHVVNEYCHPNRPFEPCPSFLENQLPRVRATDEGEWFTTSYSGGKLGETFAVCRASLAKAQACADIRRTSRYSGCGGAVAILERQASHTLLIIRTQQRDELIARLNPPLGPKACRA